MRSQHPQHAAPPPTHTPHRVLRTSLTVPFSVTNSGNETAHGATVELRETSLSGLVSLRRSAGTALTSPTARLLRGDGTPPDAGRDRRHL
ncbi:hypothetical protein [Streptomyces sp. SID12501]|uniref:Uncharacterized protein n=1 Tax=Streptomyces sp. SID12501 TaxID=2706042 RepID=A0A6B3BHU8_9ACTN|nr:hypothetical protein [Streptomyces sp. SID12501]NEC84884.1 hypothetical protein [Streptomyces sp. SID12501]